MYRKYCIYTENIGNNPITGQGMRVDQIPCIGYYMTTVTRQIPSMFAHKECVDFWAHFIIWQEGKDWHCNNGKWTDPLWLQIKWEKYN